MHLKCLLIVKKNKSSGTSRIYTETKHRNPKRSNMLKYYGTRVYACMRIRTKNKKLHRRSYDCRDGRNGRDCIKAICTFLNFTFLSFNPSIGALRQEHNKSHHRHHCGHCAPHRKPIVDACVITSRAEQRASRPLAVPSVWTCPPCGHARGTHLHARSMRQQEPIRAHHALRGGWLSQQRRCGRSAHAAAVPTATRHAMPVSVAAQRCGVMAIQCIAVSQ